MLSFENMTVDSNIFNLQRQPIIFYEVDIVNWLDVYGCDDSCADGLLENDLCDAIDSLYYDSSYSSFFITHTPDPILELKYLPDSFMSFWILRKT